MFFRALNDAIFGIVTYWLCYYRVGVAFIVLFPVCWKPATGF